MNSTIRCAVHLRTGCSTARSPAPRRPQAGTSQRDPCLGITVNKTSSVAQGTQKSNGTYKQDKTPHKTQINNYKQTEGKGWPMWRKRLSSHAHTHWHQRWDSAGPLCCVRADENAPSFLRPQGTPHTEAQCSSVRWHPNGWWLCMSPALTFKCTVKT